MFRSQARLFASLFLVLAVPTLILMTSTAIYVSNELAEEALEQNVVTARMVSKHLQEEFFGLRRYVKSFATRRRIIDSLLENDSAALKEQVAQLVEQNQKMSRAVLTGPKGRLLYDFPNDPGAAGKDFSYRDWFQGASTSELPYVSGAYERVAFDKAIVVMIASRIQADDGSALGYLGAQYVVRDLMLWLDSLRASQSERIALFDQHGEQVLRVNAAAYKNISDHPAIKKMLTSAEGSLEVTGLDGLGRCIVTHVPVPELGWTVVAYQDKEVIYAPVKRVLVIISALSLISLLALGILGWLWQRTMFAYAEDLRRSNRELESFCYSIAHDLRAPMRAMQGFSAIIADEYASKLDDEGKDCARRLGASAQRMDRLITDLLEYGSTGHVSLHFKEVELDDVLEKAVALVSTNVAEKKANIDVVKPLGTVFADETILVRVIQQILSNALRYVEDGVVPDIRIWSDRNGKYLRVWIQDNGIGIPKDQRERIFRVFERLHPRDGYTGTGIGLAIVRKGMERLGGKVGVVSAPLKGSAFWLDLPVK